MAQQQSSPVLHHRHAGLCPRNRFCPPQYRIYRGTRKDLAEYPPVPLLTDRFGESVPEHPPALRMAYHEGVLHLSASVVEDAPVISPGLDPSDPHFWEQDHIELRVLPDDRRDLDQTQIILASSGRVLTPGGETEGVSCSVEVSERGWELEATLPFSVLNLDAPGPGDVVRGVIALTRWGDNYPEIQGSAPVQLGFDHPERFGEFIFSSNPPEVTLEELRRPGGEQSGGPSGAVAVLRNRTSRTLRGTVALMQDRGDDCPGETQSQSVDLSPGTNEVAVEWQLERPLYTRFRVAFSEDNHARTLLGAATLRAGVEEDHRIAVDKLDHPRLFFNEEELESLREKAKKPAFEYIASNLQPEEADFDDADIPADPRDVSLEVTGSAGNWLRIARESLLPQENERGPRAHLHIWKLLPESAKDALREIDRTTGESEEAVGTVVNAINELLGRPDFYSKEAFADIAMPQETREALESQPDDLSEDELFRHNRTVLQCAIECFREFRLDLASKGANYFTKWVLSGDERLIRLATRCIEVADEVMITSPFMDLHTGGLSKGLAMAYDAFYPHFNEKEREVWTRVLTRFLKLYLKTARERHWNVTSIPNANPVCNSGGGLLSLALLEEKPALAREGLYYARKFIWNWLDYCTGIDGGNTEGAQYWQYGTVNFLKFAVALERIRGDDDGLLSHPGIRKAMNMVKISLCNDGNLHGFNDTIPLPVGNSIAWFCANYFDDEFGAWYGDHAQREYIQRQKAGRPTPYSCGGFWGLLLRPDTPEQHDQPELPTVRVLDDIQYGIMRSGSNYDCTLSAGMKGSRPPYTHHNQPDTGSYFIHVRGERLMIDPGYYKGEPKHHSLPVIDDTTPEQPRGYVGRLSFAEEGDLRYLACDATAAYRGAAGRVVRHLVMVGDTELVLLDDILTPDTADGQVTAQYQCGGRTGLLNDGPAFVVDGEDATLHVRPLGRPDIDLTLQPERDLKDVHWGYTFADCRHFPVTATYRARAEAPLITVFQDVTEERPGGVEVSSEGKEINV
ncbi:MAG: hypothetical protein ACLFT2_07045, partial [Candidatus Brocadiia bacterium]